MSLQESNLRETFSHAAGPGGQNVNKVATRVTLLHLPTGFAVSVQDSRSQAENRRIARERLAALLASREQERVQQARHERELRRRQRRARPAALKRALREGKRRRARTKGSRARVRSGV